MQEIMGRVELGAWVIATKRMTDENPDGSAALVALPGGVGHIIEINGPFPTIYWERSGRVFDAVEGEEFDVLCGPEGGR